MITRAPRPQNNFYLLDKAISEDKRLGWAARGMLVFLLGKPDHWQVSPAALVNETAEANRSTGRDGVYAALNELKAVGYLTVVAGRGGDGSFASTDYVIHECPVVSQPHTDFPDTAHAPHPGLPDTGLPDTANPTQVSIELKQGLKKKQELIAPVGVSESVWSDFVAHRKAKKAALTNTALEGIQREAAKAGWSMEAALTEVCARGWTGFKASWVAEKTQQTETAYQRSMREKYEVVAPSIAARNPSAVMQNIDPNTYFAELAKAKTLEIAHA